MILNKIFLALFILVLIETTRYSQSLTAWTFTYQNSTKEYPATIPSSLAWDLIDNKIVSSDPYYRDNFLQFYDYETKDAVYKATFEVNQSLLNSNHQFLIFEGLDTHAQVYLNNELIFSANNMFRRFQIEVKFKKSNLLVVNFTANTKHDLQKEKEFIDQYGILLPANYSFTRKAAYQYGWDWGPRILSVGIWKEVKVLIYNDTRIENLRFKHNNITKTIKSIDCQISVDISNLQKLSSYNLTVSAMKNLNNGSSISIYGESFFLKATTSTSLNTPFKITSNIWDYIWWTWDLGKQNQVVVKVTVQNLNTKEIISQNITTGIRSVTVIQQNKTFNGTSFSFNLNGYDVYMRGGNYIPPEMSLARTNKQTYEKIRQYAVFGRYNMIRVWGGGQFEKDDFYTQMDQAGILIWHDLMFACALYPSSSQIRSNIAAEMRDNIKRIRHHPSIGLWNGNNQVWIGWQQWGWKNKLNETQRKVVQSMYSDIFQNVLPKVLQQEHAEIYYWQTSPSSSSKGRNNGDIHFWAVWGGGAPLQDYEEYFGRFNSEYGMQSMPEISSLQRFTTSEDLAPNNTRILDLHQRHPLGYKYIPQYTHNYSGMSQNVTKFSYYSQIMQSYALEMAITSLRLNKPYNMGSLYWQLNDVWPVTSWATVDYYGTYKAAHYRVRQVYEQLIIHTLHEKPSGDYATYIVNDFNKTFNCHCTIQILTYSGQATKVKHIIQKTVKPFERVLIYRFTKAQHTNYTNSGFIRNQVRTSDGYISNNNYFFVPMIKRPNLDPGLSYTFQGSTLKITTKRLASYIWIYRKLNSNYLPLKLSDNYFTLIGGQQKSIDIGTTPHGQLYVTCYQLQVKESKKSQSRHIISQQ